MAKETTLVILGASGDLTARLLLPALGELLAREPQRRLNLVGTAQHDWDDATWKERVTKSFGASQSEAGLKSLDEISYRKVDITKSDEMAALLADLPGRIALYFAVPPNVAEASCKALRSITLPKDLILALEKPFGTDAKSAEGLNELLHELLPEEQTFRVDHFLGRSTVLNILGVRFANRVFDPVWSSDDVESILIRFDETLGLEGRAGYYDHAGALVDMIQSHLLQVLAIVCMEAPATLDSQDLRDATAAVLRATHVWQDDPVASSRRGRYTAGKVGDRSLPSYVDEPGVDGSRGTETLAEMTVEVQTERWQGVPITLRSGKAIGEINKEIVIKFKPVNHVPGGFSGDAPGSILRFNLGPDEVSLQVNMNGQSDPFELHRGTLTADLGEGTLLAYGEVLSGILDGDAALTVRGDAAVRCWKIVQPVLDAFHSGAVPLEEYKAGSFGPKDWATSTPPPSS